MKQLRTIVAAIAIAFGLSSLSAAVPNCQQFQDTVNSLQQQVTQQTEECRQITDINEKRACLQSLGQLRARLDRAREALRNCQTGLPGPGVQAARGHLTFLRAHEVGSGFGPPNDSLDVEVVFILDTQPGRAFGFQLRNDDSRPVREGMLSLLREAFENDLDVSVDYIQELNKTNSRTIRIALLK